MCIQYFDLLARSLKFQLRDVSFGFSIVSLSFYNHAVTIPLTACHIYTTEGLHHIYTILSVDPVSCLMQSVHTILSADLHVCLT